MTITKIQLNNQKKYCVYIDEKFVFVGSQKDLDCLKLSENLELTEQKYNYIVEYVYARAKDSAYRFLGYKARTEKELKDKLEKNYNEETVNQIVKTFKQYNYINDENYAKAYINNKIKSKSIKVVKYELIKKGVSNDIIDNVVDSLNIDELNTAINLIAKKFKIKTIINEKEKQKIYSYMLRQGFNYETINKALKQKEVSFEK